MAEAHPAAEPDPLEARFSLTDDPVRRAQQAIGLIPRRGGLGLGRRIALAIALTWVPIVAWALWQGRFFAGGPAEPLAHQFDFHGRFLVALPLLLVAEATSEPALRRMLPQFVRSGLVDAPLQAAFRSVLAAGEPLRSSPVALGAMIALVAAGTAVGWGRVRLDALPWTASPAQPGADFGALWFALVARPLFLLMLLVWAWRLVVLTLTFARIARLELRLVATHPDRAAGLGFLEALPVSLSPLFLAVAIPIAGHWAHDALEHGMPVRELRLPAAGLLLLLTGIAVTPLLVFAPRLSALRRASLGGWSALLAEHGRLAERRWLRGDRLADDALLTASELGPLADVPAPYQAVRAMRIAPIGLRSLLPPILAAVLPLLPVVATQIPLGDIARGLLVPLLGL
jgi:hypothetical protein